MNTLDFHDMKYVFAMSCKIHKTDLNNYFFCDVIYDFYGNKPVALYYFTNIMNVQENCFNSIKRKIKNEKQYK